MCNGYFILCLVLSIGYSLPQVRGEKGVIVVARSAGTSAHKPTAAPLLTSTPLPPLAAVKPTVAPTKAPAIIVNKPPKLSSEHLKANATKVQVSEPIELPTPPTNASAIQAEGSPRQANPLQVTGFITKNGNIYEVTDMNGIGMIESRQSPESDKSSYVCNYGSLVIYSDVPCNEVSNVRIGEAHHPVVNVAHREQNQEAPQQSSVAVQPDSADNSAANNDDANSNANSNTDQDDVGNAEDSHPAPAKKRRRVNKNSKNKRKHNDNNNVADSNSDSNEVDDFNSFDDITPEPVKKRRRVNKNSNNKRRRTGYNNQSNSLRQGTGNRRRQQAQQQQKRRRPQNNRSKSQQQRRRLQHRNQNGIRNGQRGGQSYNRRRYSDYYDYEY